MSNPRPIRAIVALGSLTALLATAACSGSQPAAPASGGQQTASSANWDEKGPITYAQGKDTSGNVKGEIDEWNKAHPNEKVTFVELSDSADQQRADMVKRAQAKSGEFSVMSVDIVWTAEFAANGWLEQLPADKAPMDGMLKSAVDGATYFNKLYAYPSTSDGALLYYRKDLLDAAGIKEPPKTWDEMKQICDKVLPGQKGMSCYAGQHQKYEGLTCNIAEAVNSAGGEFITADGKPAVNTEAAIKGVDWMAGWIKDGTIPKEAVTWKEEESRTAFEGGRILFLRNWPYVYNKAVQSKLKGKFEVAPLPGLSGPGVSTLGGHNFGISTFTKNKGTALEFVKWMNSPENQKRRLQKASNAPTVEALYSDAELTKQFPYLPTLYESIKIAKPRPKAVRYSDVTLAIQDSTYAALQGQKDPKQAFDELQTKLESLTK
ncbi:ABC transporter substrate-binding protein [Nigerium massiliense]|uniref:ABC transporter substrate-binding protein n=1 Tax=Nigerium massiliense TaxID=1522317 RepID=UPI00058C6F9A|nr:ABC transporter substrate-binding protein [Nigerium massiliense]